MKKKVLGILMIGAMAVSLAACGGGSEAESAASSAASAASEAVSEAAESAASEAAEETAAVSEAAEETTAEGGNYLEPWVTEVKKEGIKLGISNGYYGNSWRAQYVDQITQWCEEKKAEGILSEYTILNSTGDAQEELNNINQLISEEPDILMIAPNSPTVIGSVLQSAKDQGIFVVASNDHDAHEGIISIAQNQGDFGAVMAEWFAEKLDGKGKLVKITGSSGNSAVLWRQGEVERVFADYPDIEVLAEAPGEWSETVAQTVMSTFISTYGDEIDGVLAEDVMSNGIVRAYDNAGAQIPLISGDAQKSFVDWNVAHPEIETITAASITCITNVALDISLRIYWGEKLKDGVLVPNHLDESVVNAINVPMPFAIVSNPEDKNMKFWDKFPYLQVLDMNEAAALCEGKEDTYTVDVYPSQEYIDSLFE